MPEFSALLSEITADVHVDQDTNILATDFQPTRENGFIRITVACAACKIKLVPSAGTSFRLNGGEAVAGEGVFTEDIALDTVRSWNLQCPSLSGIDLKMLRIQELSPIQMP